MSQHALGQLASFDRVLGLFRGDEASPLGSIHSRVCRSLALDANHSGTAPKIGRQPNPAVLKPVSDNDTLSSRDACTPRTRDRVHDAVASQSRNSQRSSSGVVLETPLTTVESRTHPAFRLCVSFVCPVLVMKLVFTRAFGVAQNPSPEVRRGPG